ncbi:MAG: ABC transporter permease subunit [Dehalococcoidia bacterium]|nr:ABC transporter permease subunit [Dehalococcoidia bacterium]
MTEYVVRRLLAMIPTFFIVSVIVFSMVRLIPGDVVDIMVENYQYADDKEQLREQLGLNESVPVQYLTWVSGIVRGDFGESLWTGRTIMDELRYRLPLTLQLGVVSLALTVLIGIPIGILSAVKQDTAADYTARSFSILNLAIPDFWFATMVIVLPALWWQVNVSQGWVPFFENPFQSMGAILLPAIILGLSRSASVTRMTRAMMLEVLRQDYIRTAQSKGLGAFQVVSRHAVRNALIPVVTVLGLQVPAVLGGSIIMESIFNLPGTGRFMLDSIQQRDYPLLQATTMVFTVFVMFTNLMVDIAYGFLDPRIRYA